MSKELTRHALYDRVWSIPMTTLAKEYGLSGRGLAKLCERHGIPVPPRGYWAKRAAGHILPQAPLIVLKDTISDAPILIRQSTPATSPLGRSQTASELGADFQETIAQEKLPENHITLPKSLRKLHPIVAEWKQKAEQERALDKKYGRDWRAPITPLDQRKWTISSCVFTQLQARGYKIMEERTGPYHADLWITLGQDRVAFYIGERIKQFRRELTSVEKVDRFYSNQKWRQEREATGTLELTLIPGTNSYAKIKLQENAITPFEDRLNEIIIKVMEVMETARSQRLCSAPDKTCP